MNSPVGVGMIGFSHRHMAVYAQALTGMDSVRLVSAWDSEPQRGRPVCAATSMFFLSYFRELLEHPDIDALLVGGAPDLREPQILAAIRAHKPLLIQAPLADSLAAADRIIVAAATASLPITPAFPLRYLPVYRRIKALVASGIFGKIMKVNGSFRRNSCWTMTQESPDELVRNPQAVPADFSHLLDWFLWTFGLFNKHRSRTSFSSDTLTLAYDDGLTGRLRILPTPSSEHILEIEGSQGDLVLTHAEGNNGNSAVPVLRFRLKAESEWRVEPVEAVREPLDPIGAMAQAWIESLIVEKESPIPITDIREETEILTEAGILK